MADDQTKLTEFPLSAEVDVKFDASDIVRNLTPMQALALSEELDEEVGEWEYTILMYRFFKDEYERAEAQVATLCAMSDDELEARLASKVADPAEGA